MAIHLRQICLVASDLTKSVENLSEILSIPPCFWDPSVGEFGLKNTLLRVGTDFIEIVSPEQENTAAERFLMRRGGDGGYMVITQVKTKAEQDIYRARAADNGVRVAWEREAVDMHIMQLHPADMGAAFFEVDWDHQGSFTDHWHPAGGVKWKEVAQEEPYPQIIGVDLQSDDPEKLARHWGKVAGLEIRHNNGRPEMEMRNATVRFVTDSDGRGAGLSGIHLSVPDLRNTLQKARDKNCYVSDEVVEICGVRFYLS